MSEQQLQPQKNGKQPAYASVAPEVDVFESESEYLLRADLPGVAEDDVDIQLERGELRLKAKREHGLEGERLSAEFGPVIYERAFRLPEKVDADNIKAVLDAGVLELRIPKAPEIRPRKIQVKAAN